MSRTRVKMVMGRQRKRMIHRVMVLLLVTGLSAGVTACGDDDNDDPFNNQPANNGEPNNGEPNNGEPNNGEPNNGEPNNGEPNNGEPNNGEPNNGEPNNGEPNNGEPNNGEPNNQEEPDEPVEVSTPCGTAVDMGTLDLGTTHIELDTDSFIDSTTTSCGDGDGDAAILMFSKPQFDTTELDIDTDGLPAEVRFISCDVDSAVECGTDGLRVTNQPGSTRLLVIEDSDNAAADGLNVEFYLQELESCVGSEGDRQCGEDGESIQICETTSQSPDIPRWYTQDCPSNVCTDGSCEGDSCDAPIAISGGEFSWSGSLAGLTNQHSHADEADQATNGLTCTYASPETGEETIIENEGADVVFSVPNMAVGEVITVETAFSPGGTVSGGGGADSDELYVVVIKDSCQGSAACQEVFLKGSDGMTEVEYEAVSGGEKYIFVSPLPSPFFEAGQLSVNIHVE